MAEKNKIVALSPHGISKADLIALGSDPELESFQIVCHWDDGQITTGHPINMTHGQLIFGSALLAHDTDRLVFLENTGII